MVPAVQTFAEYSVVLIDSFACEIHTFLPEISAVFGNSSPNADFFDDFRRVLYSAFTHLCRAPKFSHFEARLWPEIIVDMSKNGHNEVVGRNF